MQSKVFMDKTQQNSYRRREKRTGRAQGLQGRGTVPCDTVMVDTRHHAFVNTL